MSPAPNSPAVLHVDQLSLAVDGLLLLDNLSLSVAPGEILSIIGPNGAGKSSLLRAIGGDLPISRGQVQLCGQPIGALAPLARARQMAILAQRNHLEFAFTGLEVVAMSRTPHATGAHLDEEICHAAMAALDVGHLAGRLYPLLSGGEQQRIHLARVLAQIWRAEDAGQRLLLLDEPVTSLDIGHQWQCMQAVRDLAGTGVAVLMTLHDMTLAGAFSDRLIALSGGRCCAQGTPEQVLTAAVINPLFATRVCVVSHPVTGKPVVINE